MQFLITYSKGVSRYLSKMQVCEFKKTSYKNGYLKTVIIYNMKPSLTWGNIIIFTKKIGKNTNF